LQASTDGKSAFAQLHPRMQEELYRMGWTQLRPIQVLAINAVLGDDCHILLAAQTAGGKTEAAFLPILSGIVDDHDGGVRALYVGPLKALINDQFRRLEMLCERSEIPVHKWHGDVGQGPKRALIRHPSGVLLITPESIESLLINHPAALTGIFTRLSFIVIDELHAFIGSERGAHLRSLLTRLVSKSQEPVRMIALSATLGDQQAAADWLCPRGERAVRLINGDETKAVRYIIRGYLRGTTAAADRSDDRGPDAASAEDDAETAKDDLRLAGDVFRAFRGTTSLIFANSRARLEFYADLVRREAERERLPLFRIHHGSLSKAEREDTEEALRSSTPTATFCSSTLELGIDVGNITAVGQIGPPWSVSSLAQRLGRSGRREDEPSVMRVFIEDDAPNERSRLIDRLFPGLLQTVAMTELLLERWCEPPESDRLHASTLIQQILSVIAEFGGAHADRLFDILVTRGGFVNVVPGFFADVLRGIAAVDLIEQTTEGDLILGLRGEQIVRNFDFYSAFLSADEFRVVCRGRTIGTVSVAPALGADGFLILAGRRWHVIEVNVDRKEILVEPSRGGRLPQFSGADGADIHHAVRRRMHSVLIGKEIPSYLDATAREMLGDARALANQLGIAHQHFFAEGPALTWFTWTGSRVNRTLMALGRYVGGLAVSDDGIALTFEKLTETGVRDAYRQLIAHPPSGEELAARFPVRAHEKYEWALSEELQAKVCAHNSLDLPGAIQLIQETLDRPSNHRGELLPKNPTDVSGLGE
jgi:ATP-dependent helicase Lhr and Lhr-like helicase